MIEAIVTVKDGKIIGGRTPADAEALDELTDGDYRAQFTRPGKRSLSQMGLYFLMCEMLAENVPDGGWTKDGVDLTLRLAAGHWRPVMGADGRLWQLPKSIAFNKLSSAEFSKYLDVAFDQAAKLFGPALSDAVHAELMGIMAPDQRAAA